LFCNGPGILKVLLKKPGRILKIHPTFAAIDKQKNNMKKLFFFLLPLLVLSCKSAEQYRGGIEELAGNWDTTTKAISDFSAMVSADMTNYTKAMASLQLDETTTAKLKPEQVQAWETAQKGATDALGAYSPLQKTINDFLQTWTEKSADVNALKEGLAAGKLEGDVSGKLTELSAMVTTGNENLAAWKASYGTVKNGVAAALTNLQQVMSTLTTPAPAGKK